MNPRAWIRRAKTTKRMIKKAAKEFDVLSNAYADARDATAGSDLLKEKVDMVYTNLVEAKKVLGAMAAGARKTRRASRKY